MRVGCERTGTAVDVEAQNPGKEIPIDPLTVLVLVVGTAFVAQRQIEVAIRTEEKLAAVVIAGFVTLREERLFGIEVGNARIGGGDAKTRETIMQPACGAGCGGR